MKYYKLLDLTIRLFLGLSFFVYSLVKIFDVQFATTKKITELKVFTGQELVWFFFNYSREYVFIIGLFQFIGVLFLIFNRTKIVGIFIFFPIIINILFLNIFYEINAIKSIVFYFILFLILVYLNRERITYVYKNLIVSDTSKFNFRELFIVVFSCFLLFLLSSIL
ncbi:hypothetical protein [Tenacibaculum finnmarkense]|nr:hypothetical protein [Tenacibaculum finnmarkense]MCD8412518.1 hypothetical protein [Tenacibaculum finnmarkense genomovar ulcerans]